jgi:uncharacterized glyoxalase superfamily protein PhnB
MSEGLSLVRLARIDAYFTGLSRAIRSGKWVWLGSQLHSETVGKEVFIIQLSNAHEGPCAGPRPRCICNSGPPMRVTEITETVVPTLRYRDVAAAIDWLCEAFGFERHAIVHGDDGAVCYAELGFGRSIIMVVRADGSELDAFMKQPSDIGGAETQVCYLFVADAVAHFTQAKRAGADIILDIKDEDGKRGGYSCRDPEGHVWNFGSYDPWRRRPGSGAARGRLRACVRSLVLAIATLTVIASISAVLDSTALVINLRRSELNAAGSASRLNVEEAHAVASVAEEPAATVEAQRDAAQARQELARERTEREAAHRDAEEARERLALAERARTAALEQLAAERNAREAAELAVRQVQEQLTKEQKEAAERATKKALEEETSPESRTRARPRFMLRKTYSSWPF